jgi:hypothetical protein
MSASSVILRDINQKMPYHNGIGDDKERERIERKKKEQEERKQRILDPKAGIRAVSNAFSANHFLNSSG